MDYAALIMEAASTAKTTAHIANRARFNAKMTRLVAAGPGSIQCVFDFDATISKAFHRGKRAQSCHGCLEEILPVEMKSFFDELNTKYMKIEFDPNMSHEEKTPHMVTWWSTAHAKMIEAKVKRNQIADTVKNSHIVLREGEADFFTKIRDLPILLFSAGIADIVAAAMEYKARDGLTGNMKVISNKMHFCEETNELTGFGEPLIHTFSKNSSSIGATFKPGLVDRPNVLLMGDSHGDPSMVKDGDLGGDGVCLRIGYLNRQIDQNLPVYRDLYDLVLVEDETLGIPLCLINQLF